MLPVPRLLLLLALSATAAADFTVVQKVDGLGQQSGNITIKIKDAKARADIAPQISNLINGMTGETTTLMHAQKSYMKIGPEQAKALMEQMQALQNGAKPGPPAKPVATGQKETVEQWATEIYSWTGGNMSARFWVAKDFPNGPAIQAALDKVQSGGLAAVSKNLMPASSDFPGMVVKTEMKFAGKTVTSTIVSVVEGPLDPQDFAVPADYKELATPAFNTPAPAAK